MAPTLVGLLGCGKMLPPQLNLVLEIEFAADAVRGGQNSSVDFSIKTSGFWPRRSGQRSGRKLQQSAPERAQPCLLLSDRPHAGDQRACRIHRIQRYGGTRLLEAAGRLRDLQGKRRARRRHGPGAPRHSSRRRLIPGIADADRPAPISTLSCKRLAEHHHFLQLQVMAGTYDSTFRNMRLTKNMYEGSSFIAAYPVERVPRMPLSGISTRAGDLAHFSFKGLQADKVQQCYVRMVSYQVVTLSGSGVSVLD